MSSLSKLVFFQGLPEFLEISSSSYCSFGVRQQSLTSLLIYQTLLCPPSEVWETYCVCSVSSSSYYYQFYYSSSSSFFLSPKVYPTHFSATTERKSMKLRRNVKHYEQMCRLLSEFSKWPPLPWKRQFFLKIEKHKNDHSRLFAEQILMKFDRNNIHIQWNETSRKKSESVGQTLPRLPWKQKRGI